MTGFTPENQSVPSPAPATKHGDSTKRVPELGPQAKPKRNKYAFACAILASMTSILLGYDIGVMSGAMIYIKRDLKISDLQIGILAGILNIYSLLGSCAAGRTSDWIGRRYTIVLAGAIFFAGALLMGFAPNYAFLMFGRFVAGIGVGYALMIAPVYTAEVSPASSRGFLTSFPEVFINAGIMLGYVSNLAFSKFPLKLGWRFMLGIGAIPSVVLAIGVLAMPESPRWLVMQGRLGEAKRVLDKTSDSPAEASLRLEDIKEAAGIPADCHDDVVQVSRRNSHGEGVWKELLLRPTPAVRRVMIAAIGIHFFQQASGIDAVVLFSPRIFKTAGLETDHEQLLATVAVGVVKTSFILVATFLLDRVGRRPLLLTSVGGMVLSLAVLGTSLTVINQSDKKVMWAVVLSIATVMTYVATFSIGAGPITWVYSSEIFPLRLRSQGSSMGVVVNRVTSGVISMTFLPMSKGMTTGGAFYLFGGIATVAWVFFYTFLRETQGRMLEDMDELFSGFRWRDSKNKNSGSNTEVEIGLNKHDEIYVVDEDEAQSIRFDEPSGEDSEMQNDDYGNLIGPVQKMIVSPNGKFLTLFTHDGRVVVVGMESKQIAIDYSCESALPPQQMAWCGMDSVLLYWDEDLMMVGPLGDPVHYFYDEPVILIPECDGVRILSNTSLEFLQRVPDSTESIFKIGSTSPAALLYDALDHFDRRSAKADENLRLIRSSLSEAVESCIDAAGHEFDVTRQRALLRAASYGQAFSSNFQRDRVQETCRTLRVLNAVRDPDIGIPLSIQQYKLLTPVVLISRLINAHSHLLALRISEYLGMNKEVVIMHWACAKITASASTPDAHLLEILLDKLQLCKGISYAAVATHADNCGRRKLAAMLVEHEPRSTKQVPLLLSIGEEDTALVKATESGDTDLVYLVIFHIWQKRPPLEFFAMIQGRVLARDLFVAYARCHKQEFLKDFFLSTGQIHEVAFLLWKESWDMGKNPMASKGSPLHGPRIKLMEKASNLFSQTKEHTFESKAAEEHAKLLRIQHELEASTKQAIFVDSSINDTIRTCIVLRNNRAAAKVKSEFKVSDKRWYWLKTFALATIKDWEALEKFSKEKRPPTGFRPFVEACIDADEKAEALKYIPKLSDLVERGEAYARIGMAKEAADAAAQANDGGELLERFRKTFSQNAIFDTLKMPFQGVS